MNKKLRLTILDRYGTQMEFSHALRLYPSQVSRVIKGKETLPLQEQRRWARALKCEPEQLFGQR